MIPEIGHFLLILALCIAFLQATIPLLASFFVKKSAGHFFQVSLSLAKPAAYGQSILVLISFSCLSYAFITNDFSVAYVAQNSFTSLPLFYRLAGIWGGHEGSMLLWIAVLSIWTIAVARLNASLPAVTLARVLSILAMISIGFLLFILMTSDPFLRLIPYPMEGQDLNPLLQDPGLVTHPPTLYMGYVGFAVVFSFAIAALISGQFNQLWARWMRPWCLAAWCFLTLGITLGSWWAYRVLGWGGWWFWDPVENASLMPWLAGTALIHSLMIVEKRDALKSWTLLLAILTFSLSLVGTFLVRSGILTSVHSFALDPTRGAYILKFLLMVIGGAFALFVWRSACIHSRVISSGISKEMLILCNNIFLCVILTTVALGTLYPLILEIFNLGKISVGAPYFNTMFLPLIFGLMFLMGIGPLCKWSAISIPQLFKKIHWLVLISLVLAIIIPWVLTKQFYLSLVLGLALSIWVISSALKSFKDAWKYSKISNRQWGMLVAHIGLGICAIGISVSSTYSLTHEVTMQPGDQIALYKYQLLFQKITTKQGENYQAKRGHFAIYYQKHLINTIYPEKRIYDANQEDNSIPGIDIHLLRDIYVVLGEHLDNNTWSIRIYYKPFVRLIWLGGLMMVLGGLLAFILKKQS